MKKKVGKMHNFLVCTYHSQNFAQIPENFARSHDRETVTFKNSDFLSCHQLYRFFGFIL